MSEHDAPFHEFPKWVDGKLAHDKDEEASIKGKKPSAEPKLPLGDSVKLGGTTPSLALAAKPLVPNK